MKYLFIIFFVILFVIYVLYQPSTKIAEDFKDFSNYKLNTLNKDIYNGFYAKNYDALFSNLKNLDTEISNIIHYTIKEDETFKKKDIKILDIGCGTGGHLKLLGKYNINCIGLDDSNEMLKEARERDTYTKLVKGDFHKKKSFKLREFSHILCLFTTIYYSNSLKTLLNNVNFWLKPGGFFCVHLIDDPPLVKPYKKKTPSFLYISNWKKENQYTVFEETFLFKNKKKFIKNRHGLKLYKTKYYLDLIKDTGFEIYKKIDLPINRFGKNYIFIFKKKYGA